MSGLDQVLRARLEKLEGEHLGRKMRSVESKIGRTVRVGGRDVLCFASNDYLGLAADSRLEEAAALSLRRYGAGAGASRLLAGTLTPHLELENRIADWKRTEAALVFGSGTAAAIGALGAVLGPRDVVLADRLAHASLIDGARFSGATLRVFAHNDVEQLGEKLRWARSHIEQMGCEGNILVVTESLFSMDGDFAPLDEIVNIAEAHGAWLMIDEAHANGVLGPEGSGCLRASGLEDRIHLQLGTLGKALGSAGGFVAGSRVLIEYLVHQARTFVFSTAPTPSTCAAALRGLELAMSGEGDGLRDQLRRRIRELERGLGRNTERANSPIIPVILGSEERALAVSRDLFECGIWAPAIRYPAVSRGKARLRISLSAAHQAGDVDKLVEEMRRLGLGSNTLPNSG